MHPNGIAADCQPGRPYDWRRGYREEDSEVMGKEFQNNSAADCHAKQTERGRLTKFRDEQQRNKTMLPRFIVTERIIPDYRQAFRSPQSKQPFHVFQETPGKALKAFNCR